MISGPIFRYLSGGLAIALLIFVGLWKMEQRRAGKLSHRVSELTELRKADRKAYEAAQAEAKAKNKAQVQKIEAQHEAITNNVRSDYARDLERLRQQANRGSTRGPGVSQVPEAPGGADGDGMSPPACDDLCASEIELRLMHLQNWVREQTGASEH